MDDGVVHSTGYVITPFVGFIPYPYPFRASELETKDIFFVPLRVLMDPRRFHRRNVLSVSTTTTVQCATLTGT